MKRLFFPHTAITPALAAALHAVLGPTTLLHPLREAVSGRTAELAEDRQIELIFPARGDGEDLMTAMASFRHWAAGHAGSDLSGLVGRGEAVPFFGADAPSQIIAEIKGGLEPRGEAASGERLQRARLLLLLAEEFDARQSELASDLMACADEERRILEELKGDDDALAETVGPPATIAAAPVMHMLAPRVAAWAQLALATADAWAADPPVLLLAVCREVLDHISDSSSAEFLLERHPVSPTSEGLRAWLADPRGLPPADETPVSAPSIRLTLVRLNGQGLRGWLRGMAGVGSGAVPDPGDDPSAHAVLAGMVERG